MADGIYTLANDAVYDQLVALLNSIEVQIGKDFPICIVPYDDRLERVRQEVQKRKNVFLFEDWEAIAVWEAFATDIWQAHPTAVQNWSERGISGVSRMGMHRRFACFDGPFDRFIYLDADILIMNRLDVLFQHLDRHDFVIYDFQYKDLSHVFNPDSAKTYEVFPQERLQKEIFCAGLFASKKGLFPPERRAKILARLQSGDADMLYANAPDQSILNYMVMSESVDSCNLSFALPVERRTGCCVTSPHFEYRDGTLYDKGNRLTYLHYIGVSSQLFARLCAGENMECPYREVFLHYRYLNETEKRPTFQGKPMPLHRPPSLFQRALRKLSSLGSKR